MSDSASPPAPDHAEESQAEQLQPTQEEVAAQPEQEQQQPESQATEAPAEPAAAAEEEGRAEDLRPAEQLIDQADAAQDSDIQAEATAEVTTENTDAPPTEASPAASDSPSSAGSPPAAAAAAPSPSSTDSSSPTSTPATSASTPVTVATPAPVAAITAPAPSPSSSPSSSVPLTAHEEEQQKAAIEAAQVQQRIAQHSKRREEEMARQKREEEKEYPEGFHYAPDSDELCRYLKPFELSKEFIHLHASFGYASQKRNNIHYIDFGVLLFAAGNTVQIMDLFASGGGGGVHMDHRKKTVLQGHGRESHSAIGAIAVHPSKQFFAVAEKGTNPNIYIYNYPALQVVRILEKGTEQGYADVQFSHTGDKLVSVGTTPDFLMTVWDWRRERVILRTKAFSQEVYRVMFSPVNEGRLLTSGTGHIRFWKMARTFTGLKLQGMIGKFGNVELSDISAFVELPDGKVLSGTESGHLLMWDGNFIQFTVMRGGPTADPLERTPCHQGMIEFVALDESNGIREIVTGGADGFVRKWRFDALEFAEAPEEDPVVTLTPTLEIKIGSNVSIRSMLRGDDHWIIQDYNGGIYKLWLADYQVQKLVEGHSGKIHAVVAAPHAAHVTVTAGHDASVRCWDVLRGEQLYSRQFNAPAICLLWAPAHIDSDQRTLLVGFGDGVVRVLKRYKDGFKLHHAFKPHTDAVKHMAIAPDGSMLATAAADGQVFFLSIVGRSKLAHLVPLGFIKLPQAARSLQWKADSSRVLLASGADVIEFHRPDPELYGGGAADNRDTYEISLPHRIFRPIIRDDRPRDPQEELDRADQTAADLIAAGAELGGPEVDEFGYLRHPEPPKPRPVLGVDIVYDIGAVLYNPREPDNFFLTLDGGGNREDPQYFPGQLVETLYECKFSTEQEVGAAPPSLAGPPSSLVTAALESPTPGLNGIPLRSTHLGRHMGTVHTLSLSASGQYLLIGTRNGGVQLRSLDDLQYFFYEHYHDGSGATTGHQAGDASSKSNNNNNTSAAATAAYLSDRIGVVSGVSTTFDDRFLMSVGYDGNFFAHAIDPQGALQQVDRSIENKVAEERLLAEEKRQAKIRAREEEIERKKKEEEERQAKEQALANKKDTRTRDQKDREAREAKEREEREKREAEEREKARLARLKLLEEHKDDWEREDENFDHLSIRIPERTETALELPNPDDFIENIEAKKAASSSTASSPTTSSAEEDALDITDPKSYSIEEAKLKQEEDDRVLAAEKKKARMRLEIAELRKEFVSLLQKNASLEPAHQVPRERFELDPHLREELEAEAQAKIEEVRAELAWISEKHSLALQKLRAKFLDPLVVEHITLRAFRSGVSVSSFRTPQLPPFLRTAIEQVHKMMESEENLRTQQEQQLALVGGATAGGSASSNHQRSGSSGSTALLGMEEEKDAARGSGLRGALKARSARLSASGALSSSAGRTRPPGISEAELRKQARAERAIQLAKLKAAKPDKNVDDPADVAAVQYAEKHMGDYKLKSDPHYIVPEHQRVNAERKRRQMVLLQESVHYIKMALNERFLALRDLKARIIKNIARDNVRLKEINVKLGIDEPLYEPQLDPTEWPEHRELFTREDLDKFEKEREKEKQRAANAKAQSIFSSGPEEEEEESKEAENKEGAASTGFPSEPTSLKALAAATPSASLTDSPSPAGRSVAGRVGSAARQDVTLASSSSTSSLSSTESSAELAQLREERRSLLDKMHYAIRSFDSAVSKLRREKLKLDSDLKSTDLKVLTLFQELHLLKDFEETENRLFAKLSKARANKAQVVSEMAECEKALSHKLSEIKAWQEKDKQVLSDFNLVVGGEKSEFYPALLKIFKKKVKRSKGGKGKASRGGDDMDDDGDDSDDGADSSSDSDSGDESESDESDDDSCPLHLDSAIYEKVLELREKRMEQEEVLAEFNKSVAELHKSYERLGSRERLIDKELTATENDIEAFQSEKQRALNLIEVAVPLKLSQIKFLQPDGRLPRDISQALIFTSTGLQQLQRRILELGAEKASLSKQFKDLKKQHKLLLRELAVKREEIAVEKKKCEDVQLLKFGQIIDLSLLEKVGVDEGAAELRGQLRSLESSSVQQLHEWDHKIEEAKNELARVTEQNTRWLDKVAKLTKAQYELEDQLNNTTKNVHVADSAPMDEQNDMERKQLLELVQLQEREIDALKAEIHVLRRKGGHVYTPQP